MKNIRWMVVSLFTGLLIAGCAVPNGPDEEEDVVSEPELEIQSSGIERDTYFYNNAAHTTVVGHCHLYTCPPKSSGCTGIKTPYYEIEESICYF